MTNLQSYPEQEPRIVGVYRNLVTRDIDETGEIEDWRDHLAGAAANCPDIHKVKPVENWRMHLFSADELYRIPSGAFDSTREAEEALADPLQVSRVGQPFYTPTRDIHVFGFSRVAITIVFDKKVRSDRHHMAQTLLDDERVGLEIRDGQTIENGLAATIIFAIAKRHASFRNINRSLRPHLPEMIRFDPVKTKAKEVAKLRSPSST